MPLVAAIYTLESAIDMELRAIEEEATVSNAAEDLPVLPTALLKNAGLGHVHLMKSKIVETLEKKKGLFISIKIPEKNSGHDDGIRRLENAISSKVPNENINDMFREYMREEGHEGDLSALTFRLVHAFMHITYCTCMFKSDSEFISI